MKNLIDVIETYRVDTEAEVQALLDSAKNDSTYSVSKYNCVAKEKKQKGEVIESWYKVTIGKHFTDEKEPDRNISINYEDM